MDEKRQQIITDWIASAEDAVKALRNFQLALEIWREHNEDDKGFMTEFRLLANAGIEDWIDRNPLDVDRLWAVVTGEPLPEPEPMTEVSMIEAIFGTPAKEQPL